METLLKLLLIEAKRIGLPNQDIEAATEFLEHNEHFLCLDTVATQAYEYNLAVSDYFCDLVSKTANRIGITPNEYFYLQNLPKRI